LAALPKLRRVGLVKCSAITDKSVYALARHSTRMRSGPSRPGYPGEHQPYYAASSLERVHLSYCTLLTLSSVIVLLNNCRKLTHLSLTGAQAFLRTDLEKFCREAPAEFTEHQRNVFCVFSGRGVTDLRTHLNKQIQYQEDEYDNDTVNDADDDQTMTGMMGAAALNADDEDADGDEELDADVEGA